MINMILIYTVNTGLLTRSDSLLRASDIIPLAYAPVFQLALHSFDHRGKFLSVDLLYGLIITTCVISERYNPTTSTLLAVSMSVAFAYEYSWSLFSILCAERT
jgi:hypothetical protein